MFTDMFGSVSSDVAYVSSEYCICSAMATYMFP
jgi:hypothetical protein